MTQPVPSQPAPDVTMVTPEGERVTVAAGDIRGAVAEGLAFDAPVVISPGYGDPLREVDPVTATRAFSGVGNEQLGLSSSSALGRQVERERYSGLGQAALAGVEGGLSGLTFGGYDYAATKLGADTAKRAEYNPNVRLVGELGGALVPLAFTGGTSAGLTGAGLAARGTAAAARGANVAREASLLGRAGELATAAPRGLSALAEGAGGATARGLEALGAAEGGLAARGARAVATGAVEGAGYGAGSAVSQAALRDEPLTIEKIVAGAGHGALLGGALGGGMVGLSALGSAAKSKVEAAVERLAGAPSGAGENAVQKFLRETSEEAAVRGLGGTKKQVGKIEAALGEREGAMTRLRDVVLDDLPTAVGKPKGAILSKGEQNVAAQAFHDSAGKKLGAIVDELSATPVRVDLAAFAKAAEAKASSVEKLFGGKVEAAKIRETAAEIQRAVDAGEGSLRSLQMARSRFGAEFDAGVSKSTRETKKLLYSELSKEFERSGETAAKLLGKPEAVGAWKSANLDYQIASLIRPAAESGAAAMATNRLGGLSEHLSILGALGAGGGAPAAIAAGVGARVVKAYGSQMLAHAARAGAEGQVLSRFAAATDAAIGKSAGSFVAGKSLAAGARRVATDVTERKRSASAYDDAAASVRMGGTTEGRVAGATSSRPDLGASIGAKVDRDRAFLASKLPPERSAALGRSKAPPVDPETRERFLRYYRAVTDPLSVLDDMAKGRVTREAVEAIRATSPALFGDIQGKVLHAVSTSKTELPYERRVALSLLLDTPIDPTMSPQFIATIQAVFPKDAPPGQPGAPPTSAPKRPLSRAEDNTTAAERLLGSTE